MQNCFTYTSSWQGTCMATKYCHKEYDASYSSPEVREMGAHRTSFWPIGNPSKLLLANLLPCLDG